MTHPLRDPARLTRLLVLGAVHDGASRLGDIAKALDISVQAAGGHVRALREAGRIETDALRVTPAGRQWLIDESHIAEEAARRVAAGAHRIPVVSARAAADLDAGATVALVMEEGDLVAVPGDGPSRGITRNAAVAGDEVVVGDLEGMAPLRPGAIRLEVVPGPAEGGAGKLAGRRPDGLVAALGTGAALAAADWGVDLRFAPVEAAINAAHRGLDVVLVVSRDRLAEALAALESARPRIDVGLPKSQ